jgi:hypothetical protein
MARIEIKNLPVAHKLTPEQEELLKGAGLRSFRPTFEVLEGRQLMAAHLGSAFLARPPVLDNALGRDTAPRMNFGQQNHFRQDDANWLRDESKQILSKNLINDGWNLRGFRDVRSATVLEASDTKIQVEVKLSYGHFGYPKDLPAARFVLDFGDFGDAGGQRVYKLTNQGHFGYDGAGGDASLDQDVVNAFKREFRTTSQFDHNAGKIDHSRAEDALEAGIRQWAYGATGERSYAGLRGYLGGINKERTADGLRFTIKVTCALEKWEADDNASFKKQLSGEIVLTFKYRGMFEGKEQYVCTDVGTKNVLWKCTAWNRKTEYYDGQLENFGIGDAGSIRAHFSPQTQDAPMPHEVSQAAFGSAQKLLSGLQFKDLSLTKVEELTGGVRMKIHAQRADGKWVDFSVDVKYDGANGYKCDRASVDYHGDFAMSDAEVAALKSLPQNLHGNWR